jgi:hypothetical protein
VAATISADLDYENGEHGCRRFRLVTSVVGTDIARLAFYTFGMLREHHWPDGRLEPCNFKKYFCEGRTW